MKFWNWGPKTILHNRECIAFYFSKLHHPTVGAQQGASVTRFVTLFIVKSNFSTLLDKNIFKFRGDI